MNMYVFMYICVCTCINCQQNRCGHTSSEQCNLLKRKGCMHSPIVIVGTTEWLANCERIWACAGTGEGVGDALAIFLFTFKLAIRLAVAFVCAARRFLDALRCDNLQRAWHATEDNALRGCHMAKALNCWHCVEEASTTTASAAVAVSVVASLLSFLM